MEYLIRNGGIENEEYYLKGVEKDKEIRFTDPQTYGVPNGRGRKWKSVKPESWNVPEKKMGGYTSSWTRDETQAMYFPTRKAAQDLIRKHGSLLRFAVVMEAGI